MADFDKNGSVDQCEESRAEETVPVAESGSPKDSIVKYLEEEFSEAARSVVDKVAESSFVEEVEKLVHVSDPWDALKNLGCHKDEQNKEAPEESTLPASDENVGESPEKTSDKTQVVASKERETDDLHENQKATHTQPFVAVSASSKASWANCCGLLDFLKPSDQ
ncbi:uncharacterized protein LOC142522318 [Primulina tabacum]|uniref:uncharacterized protein LOC142522318 n=1 Tax=Primulina tabacum TaxID=48773 RepID=UPI003F5A4CA6